MSELDKGWYVVPTNDRREHYWNGEKFIGNQRRRPTTPFAPFDPTRHAATPAPSAPPRSNPFAGRAAFLYVITTLSAIGTVVLTVVLFTATHRECSDIGCFDVRNDAILPGVIAAVTGTLQTAFLLILSQMCMALGSTIETLERRA